MTKAIKDKVFFLVLPRKDKVILKETHVFHGSYLGVFEVPQR